MLGTLKVLSVTAPFAAAITGVRPINNRFHLGRKFPFPPCSADYRCYKRPYAVCGLYAAHIQTHNEKHKSYFNYNCCSQTTFEAVTTALGRNITLNRPSHCHLHPPPPALISFSVSPHTLRLYLFLFSRGTPC